MHEEGNIIRVKVNGRNWAEASHHSDALGGTSRHYGGDMFLSAGGFADVAHIAATRLARELGVGAFVTFAGKLSFDDYLFRAEGAA